jgi:hypothetical protein
MSAQAKSAVSAVAVLAAVSLPMLTPDAAANAADPCLTAPNRQAPQGSHWYYRIERPSMRKCWRLVQKDRKEERAAKQAAPPEGDDDTEETPAPPADRPAATDTKPAEPVIRTLVTRPVSSTTEATQQPPDPVVASAPAERDASAPQAPARPVDQPAPQGAVAPMKTIVADNSGTPGLGTLLAALGLLGLLAGASYAALWIVRRRTDVLEAVRDASGGEASFDHRPPASSAPSAAPTFSPLPPMATMAGEDDVDAALRRFSRTMKRRAA